MPCGDDIHTLPIHHQGLGIHGEDGSQGCSCCDRHASRQNQEIEAEALQEENASYACYYITSKTLMTRSWRRPDILCCLGGILWNGQCGFSSTVLPDAGGLGYIPRARLQDS